MSEYRIKGETGDWEVVVGLEVHAQVVSNAKLFSGAATAFGAEPNTQVSLVDAAMPVVPELNNILGWVEQLGEVDTDGVEPLTAVIENHLRLRDEGALEPPYPRDQRDRLHLA